MLVRPLGIGPLWTPRINLDLVQPADDSRFGAEALRDGVAAEAPVPHGIERRRI